MGCFVAYQVPPRGVSSEAPSLVPRTDCKGEHGGAWHYEHRTLNSPWHKQASSHRRHPLPSQPMKADLLGQCRGRCPLGPCVPSHDPVGLQTRSPHRYVAGCLRVIACSTVHSSPLRTRLPPPPSLTMAPLLPLPVLLPRFRLLHVPPRPPGHGARGWVTQSRMGTPGGGCVC